MKTATSLPEPTDVELLDVHGVARLLAMSPRTVYARADDGAMPRPVKIGRLTRWRASTLRAWLDDGCPRQAPGAA